MQIFLNNKGCGIFTVTTVLQRVKFSVSMWYFTWESVPFFFNIRYLNGAGNTF